MMIINIKKNNDTENRVEPLSGDNSKEKNLSDGSIVI